MVVTLPSLPLPPPCPFHQNISELRLKAAALLLPLEPRPLPASFPGRCSVCLPSPSPPPPPPPRVQQQQLRQPLTDSPPAASLYLNSRQPSPSACLPAGSVVVVREVERSELFPHWIRSFIIIIYSSPILTRTQNKWKRARKGKKNELHVQVAHHVYRDAATERSRGK